MLNTLKWVVRSSVGIIALVLAFGIFFALSSTRPQPAKNPESQQATTVGVVPATLVEVERTWTGYGSARALRRVDVPTEIAALVKDRPQGIEDGAWVTANETTLLTLDKQDLDKRVEAANQRIAARNAQIDSLNKQLERLKIRDDLLAKQEQVRKDDLQRIEDALAQGAGNQIDLDTRTESLLQVQQQREQVLTELDLIQPRIDELEASILAEEADRDTLERDATTRTNISAPITGYIQDFDAESGEYLNRGTRIATIVDLRRIEIPLRIPMNASATLNLADPVILSARTGDNGVWGGRIARIAPDIEATSRSVIVFVVVDQTDLLAAELGVEPESIRLKIDEDKLSDIEKRIAEPVDLGDLPPAESLLRPGVFVTGEVLVTVETEQLIIPRRAIRDGKVSLLVRNEQTEEDKAITNGDSAQATPASNDESDPGWRIKSRPVTTLFAIRKEFPGILESELEWIAIRLADGARPDGLNPGDLIVYEGLDKVSPGLRVSPVLPSGQRVEGASANSDLRGAAGS